MDSAVSEVKKPIPTPRRSVRNATQKTSEATLEPIEEPREEHNNTLTKRVSSASRQLAGDLSQLVLDRKKAVIEGTRQSVRRIARRFSSGSQEQNSNVCEQELQNNNDEDTINIFSTIRFNSPICQTENIYNNIDNDNVSTSSDEELTGLPPPSHPPPPLPSESVYDAPSSVISNSNSEPLSEQSLNNTKVRSNPYESVFPPFRYQSDSDSTSGTNSNEKFESLSRSGSWRFYDAVGSNGGENVSNKEPSEKIVNNLSGGNIDLNSNISINSSTNVTNSLYENHEVAAQASNARPSKSIILQFDPLNKDNNGGKFALYSISFLLFNY